MQTKVKPVQKPSLYRNSQAIAIAKKISLTFGFLHLIWMLRKNTLEGEGEELVGGLVGAVPWIWDPANHLLLAGFGHHQHWRSQGRLIREEEGCDGDFRVLSIAHCAISTLCNFTLCNFHTVKISHCAISTLCNFNTVQFPHCANFTVYNLHTIYIVRCSRQSTALCNGDFRVLACVQLGSVLVLVCNLLVHQHNVLSAIW